jgi:hypothetical protein
MRGVLHLGLAVPGKLSLADPLNEKELSIEERKHENQNGQNSHLLLGFPHCSMTI